MQGQLTPRGGNKGEEETSTKRSCTDSMHTDVAFRVPGGCLSAPSQSRKAQPQTLPEWQYPTKNEAVSSVPFDGQNTHAHAARKLHTCDSNEASRVPQRSELDVACTRCIQAAHREAWLPDVCVSAKRTAGCRPVRTDGASGCESLQLRSRSAQPCKTLILTCAWPSKTQSHLFVPL